MAFQSVPETAEIGVIYEMNGVTVQNVFYARFPGGYTQTELDLLAVRVDLRVTTHWLDDQPPEAIYQRVDVRGLEFINDLVATFTSGPLPGTALTAALPNNVTLAIKQNSGFSGRSARGRVFWIGSPQGTLDPADENTFLAAVVVNIVNDIMEVRTGIQALVGWDAVLVSRITGGAVRPLGVTFPWISENAVDSRVDSQRGRLPG